MFFGVQIAVYFPSVAGDFHGVEVLGVYTVAPIVIATSTNSGFLIVNMIGTYSSSLNVFILCL